MRALILVFAVVSCAAETSSPALEPERTLEATPDDIPSSSSSGGGGTPANLCEEAPSASAVGCPQLQTANGRYCSDYRTSPTSAGKCLAPLTTGTMAATVGAKAFTAALVGARRLSNGALEIAGFSAPSPESSDPNVPGAALRLTISGGVVGTGTCGSLGFTETGAPAVWFSFADVGTCSYELTDDGNTSGIVTGTFTATIRESSLSDAPSREITGGTFSVTLSK
jgi:hypothetical protein